MLALTALRVHAAGRRPSRRRGRASSTGDVSFDLPLFALLLARDAEEAHPPAETSPDDE
jgi:hypothetical protein